MVRSRQLIHDSRNVLGDFNPEMPDDHVVCVDAVVDFTSAFLFSVETQHTIGLVSDY